LQNSSSPVTVVFAAGGTAGHVYPALAMAEKLQSFHSHFEVVFVGAENGLEEELVQRDGQRFIGFSAAPYHRTGLWGRLKIPPSVMKCFLQSRAFLRQSGAGLVVGFGGFVTVGVFLAARSLGIPIIVHEANVTPGLANRMFGRVAARVFLGWGQAAPTFPPDRTQVVGLPVRSSVLQAGAESRKAPASDARPFNLLITGGSEGSPFLNRRAPDLVAALCRLGLKVDVIHQCGFQDAELIEEAYGELPVNARIIPFIDEMAEAYKWADFAVSCAGAGTLSELAVMGLPALVVPLSSAAEDHQTANARAAAEAGTLWWIGEAQWDTEHLAARIAKLWADQRQWLEYAESMRSLAHYHAAESMLRYCLRMLG